MEVEIARPCSKAELANSTTSRAAPALHAKTAKSATQQTRNDRLSLLACLIGTFVLRAAAAIMGSTIQLYFGYIDQHIYPLSDSARGFALAIFFLPELAGSPVLGAWSDNIGRKPFILLGSLFGGIGVQLTAMTTSYPALALMRLLGGLSTASAIPATLGYLSAVTSTSESLRGRAMGFFQLATIGGTVLGILLGGRLWDLFHQSAFTIDAGIYLLSALIFYFGIAESPVNQKTRKADAELEAGQALGRTIRRYRTLFSSANTLRFAPAFLAICMILGIWLNHIVSQLVSSDRQFPNQLLYGALANNKSAGTDISLFGAAILALFGAGALFWSFVLDRYPRTKLMLLNASGLFPLCFAIYVLNHSASFAVPGVPFLVLIAAASLFLVSGIMPTALTFIADVTEETTKNRGAVMGLFTILFGFGGFLGTLLGGPFADWRAIDGILALTALLGFAAVILLARLHQQELRQPIKSGAILPEDSD